MNVLYFRVYGLFSLPGFSGFAAKVETLFKLFLCSCDRENYVQCVKYAVLGLVHCLLQCDCHTPPATVCQFSIKITLKDTCLSLSRGSTPEGTQSQSAVEGVQSTRSVDSPKIGPSARIEHP